MKQRKEIIYMSNRMIGKCKYRDQDYCMECSEHKHWEEFCNECFKGYYNEYQDKESFSVTTLPTVN